MKSHPISKSQYAKGLSCSKKLWLYREQPELATPKSLVQDAIFTQGHEVGRLAHSLFPGGVLIKEDHSNPKGALLATSVAINAGAVAIFEAAFNYEDLLIRADIIVRNDDGTWDLLEVKSSTKVKDEHLADVAIQKFVIQNSGHQLRKSCLLHLNSKYIRRSGPVPANEIFTVTPLDEEIQGEYNNVVSNLGALRSLITHPKPPTVRLSSACKNPHPCEFKEHCWRDISDESIHYLGRILDKKRNALLDRNIELIAQIPEEFELSAAQKIEADCARTKKTRIERIEIEKHMAKLKWPRYFLDFESIGFAIPEYIGTSPYEALAFQYSLHVQKKPGAEIEHREFLFDRHGDPRRALAKQLTLDIGEEGSVIAYHASFERSRLEEMAEVCPELMPSLNSIADRLWDLETPFAKRWYWDHRFRGSSSIKKVLPVLVPGMSYDGLEIHRGDEAQLRYQTLISLPNTSAEHEKIRRDLLEYCGQDSLAMVRVLDALERALAAPQ